jgi:anti-sigma regulatory factor (Ser/Thr protein kinase)
MTAPTFEHDALFYDSDERFVSAIAPFLQDGLARGEGAACATTGPHIEMLQDALGSDAARVSFFTDEEWYVRPWSTLAAWQDVLKQSERAGRSYVRIVGEVRFGATDESRTAWTRYESAINRAFEGSRSWIVCPYDSRKLPAPLIEAACRTHPTVWNTHRQPSDGYADPETMLAELPEPMPVVSGEPSMALPIGDNLSQIRDLVRRIALEERLDPRQAEDLTLAVSEVAANSIRHGQSPRRLALWLEQDRVICEVSDRGDATLNPLAGYLPPRQGATGGMGLWVVGQLCQSLAIDTSDAGTKVRFALTR